MVKTLADVQYTRVKFQDIEKSDVSEQHFRISKKEILVLQQ